MVSVSFCRLFGLFFRHFLSLYFHFARYGHFRSLASANEIAAKYHTVFSLNQKPRRVYAYFNIRNVFIINIYTFIDLLHGHTDRILELMWKLSASFSYYKAFPALFCRLVYVKDVYWYIKCREHLLRPPCIYLLFIVL